MVELQSNFQLRVERHPRLLLVLLYFALWLVKNTCAILSTNQMQKTNLNLVTGVFPLFGQFTCFCLEHSLAPLCDSFFDSDWWFFLLCFCITTLNWKALLSSQGLLFRHKNKFQRIGVSAPFSSYDGIVNKLFSLFSLISTLVIMGGFHSNSLNLIFSLLACKSH